MSKYQELCKLYEIDFYTWNKYRDDCHDFYVDLLGSLLKYLEISSEKLHLLSPKNDKVIEKVVHSAYFIDDDSFYHLNVALNVQIDENTYPKEDIKFEILIKRKSPETNIFIVKLIEDKEFEIAYKKADSDFSSFFDHLYKILRSVYEDSYAKFLSSSYQGRNKVGFKFEKLNN